MNDEMKAKARSRQPWLGPVSLGGFDRYETS